MQKMRMKRHINYNFGSLCALLFRFTSSSIKSPAYDCLCENQ